MKCPTCNSCVRLIRVELNNEPYLNWYCEFCKESFDINSKKVVDNDSELHRLTRIAYEEKYKDGVKIRLK
jgi:hypothetical protein